MEERIGGAYGGMVFAGALGVVVVGEHGVAADPLAPHRRRGATICRLRRRRHRRRPLPVSLWVALEKSKDLGRTGV